MVILAFDNEMYDWDESDPQTITTEHSKKGLFCCCYFSKFSSALKFDTIKIRKKLNWIFKSLYAWNAFYW